MLPLHIANIIIISHLKNFSCCFSNKFTSLWQNRENGELSESSLISAQWCVSESCRSWWAKQGTRRNVYLFQRVGTVVSLHDFATGVNGRCWELVGSTLSRYLFWIDIACNLPCRHLRHNICAVFRLRLVDEEFMVAYWLLLSLNFSRGMPRASATSAIKVFSFV